MLQARADATPVARKTQAETPRTKKARLRSGRARKIYSLEIWCFDSLWLLSYTLISRLDFSQISHSTASHGCISAGGMSRSVEPEDLVTGALGAADLSLPRRGSRAGFASSNRRRECFAWVQVAERYLRRGMVWSEKCFSRRGLSVFAFIQEIGFRLLFLRNNPITSFVGGWGLPSVF